MEKHSWSPGDEARFGVLLERCLSLSLEQRERLFQEECCDSPALEQRLRDTLRAESKVAENELLQSGGVAQFFSRLNPASFAPRDFCGRYRLIAELGRGGMGVVYRGELKNEPEMGQVAIKLIKRGMDSDAILQRFLQERTILAKLKGHPSIVHLEDADVTEDGLPFFVMEYIEGTPIDSYVASAHLSVTDCLRLFRKVCAAVFFAHQRFIIHRDLTPANILVTAAGEPKLLDFGIAKLLSPTAAQEGGQSIVQREGIMTAQYASPEQVMGELTDDIRTDVYSLGVVLYRLLCGQPPYVIRSDYPRQRIQKIICETEPKPPSAHLPNQTKVDRRARRKMQGDLDRIVLTALRKDPERRYVSVEQFSNDIGRYLDHLPIVVRDSTWRYRSGRFVLRHRVGVSVAFAFLLLLLAATGLVSWQAHVARVQRNRAEIRFNDVRALAKWLVFDFHDQIETLPGATAPRKRLVEHALSYLDQLEKEASGDPGLEREVAQSYVKLGDVQGYPRDSNEGDLSAALQSYQKALHIFDRLQRLGVANTETLRYQAIAQQRVGEILLVTGETTQSLAIQQQAASTMERLAAKEPTWSLRRSAAVSHTKVGEALEKQGREREALAEYKKGLPTFQQLAREHPGDLQTERDLTVQYSKFGDVYRSLGAVEPALQSYNTGITLRQQLLATHLNNRELERDVATSLDRISSTLADAKRLPAALEYEQRALAIDRRQLTQDSDDQDTQRDVADDQCQISDLELQLRRPQPALAAAEECRTLRSSLAAYNQGLELQAEIADASLMVGMAHLALHHKAQAYADIHTGLRLAEHLHAADGADTQASELLAKSRYWAAKVAEPASRESANLVQSSIQLFTSLQHEGKLSSEGNTMLTAALKLSSSH